ncbi:chemotaxis protein CheB [Deinococcus peraridilitoris]|uniref:protein-glutamate methylesterase n=1 Tax=Deinococcus peraridilitoris (strain DSM 19664 / LMG 22246 / CIP 109416 / KR-200) TaxID=937777 RepID=L0A418_DEIPD|nr:chemotaxis protein CheB [Deinococcus peraridilitoris]AFZ68618.1 chemotaxis response regulator containing a CheY-like receiver domain and a methylesterase domain protein [Deinococcus peraridilitoris DSM 19664]
MQTERLVVIGGSAGALDALRAIVRDLPRDFPAAVLVVVHISPDFPSRLAQILNDSGPLEACHARDGDPLRAGVIHVAPPDHHLLVQRGHLRLTRSPKENRARPSIDVLFRSAAYTHGAGVMGVLLSGMLDDGTSGLWTIKQLGGQVIVQHPEEAPQPSMPLSALRQVEVDEVLGAGQIGPHLSEWAFAAGPLEEHVTLDDEQRRRLEVELGVATEDNAFELGVLQLGPLSPFTCPECHGVMVQIKEGNSSRFRCHTGHAFSPSSLLAEVRDSVEASLWSAARALDENVMLLEHLARHFGEAGEEGPREAFTHEALHAREQARLVRQSALHAKDQSDGRLLQFALESEQGQAR